jgi:hypothetical protein
MIIFLTIAQGEEGVGTWVFRSESEAAATA